VDLKLLPYIPMLWKELEKKNSIGLTHLQSTHELCPAQQEALPFQGCLAKFIHSFIPMQDVKHAILHRGGMQAKAI
jgi:hypothetical protein